MSKDRSVLMSRLRDLLCSPARAHPRYSLSPPHGAGVNAGVPRPLGTPPKIELGNGDGISTDVDGHRDYIWLKEEPEVDFTATDGRGGDGGAGDDRAPGVKVDTDDCYGPVKEEPEPEIAITDGAEEGCYGCDPLKEEPESELVATGEDADGGRDAGFDCSHCGVVLSTREFKDEHEFRCKVQIQQRKLESQVTEVYRCGFCRCPFLNEEYKEQHQQKYCRKRPVVKRKDPNRTCFECDKCKYVTKFKKDLTRHRMTHNKNNAEWFACTQCSYRTVHKHCMTRHKKIHSDAFTCCCSICGKSFREKRCLDGHLVRQHSDESDEVSTLITSKIYTCDICDQFRTSKKTDFNDHLRIKHNKGVGCQKYECPRCPYFTFTKGNLTKHSKRHAGQKDYQCAVCPKQFTQKRDLDSHILYSHSSNADLMKTITSKMHRCQFCSFRTIVLTNLKKHVRSNHV